MNPLDRLRRIAEVEFSDLVVQTDILGAKSRVLLTDSSYIDVWASRKLSGAALLGLSRAGYLASKAIDEQPQGE